MLVMQKRELIPIMQKGTDDCHAQRELMLIMQKGTDAYHAEGTDDYHIKWNIVAVSYIQGNCWLYKKGTDGYQKGTDGYQKGTDGYKGKMMVIQNGTELRTQNSELRTQNMFILHRYYILMTLST